jgi:hypothetical protein
VSNLSVNTITNAAGGNTAQINGMTPTADSLQGFRNRIINGNMVIDQRNAGASVTITNTGALTYTLDRWAAFGNAASKFSVQQVSDAPSGFVNSLKITSLAATTVASGDQYTLNQSVEGFNTSDLGWGTTGAQTVTLSFWVKSSLTGTFGGVFVNNAIDRGYGFNYTVSAANTWEQKTVVVSGDTTGTWATNNTVGIRVYFGLGVGSTFAATPGVWQAGSFRSATGAVSVVGTSGATFFITGVQLEAGAVATPFERRDYGRELIMCQRYFQTRTQLLLQTSARTDFFSASILPFPVTMRAAPTVTLTNGSTINLSVSIASSPSPTGFSLTLAPISTDFVQWGGAGTGAYTASIEL